MWFSYNVAATVSIVIYLIEHENGDNIAKVNWVTYDTRRTSIIFIFRC